MKTETIVYCVVALLLGMLLANMLKNVCGCRDVVEGQCTSTQETGKENSGHICESWDKDGNCNGALKIMTCSDFCKDAPSLLGSCTSMEPSIGPCQCNDKLGPCLATQRTGGENSGYTCDKRDEDGNCNFALPIETTEIMTCSDFCKGAPYLLGSCTSMEPSIGPCQCEIP